MPKRLVAWLCCMGVGLAGAALSGCATTGAAAREARAQQNTAVVLAFIDTVFNKHEVDQAFRLYVGPTYRQHNPGIGDGIDAARQFLTRLTHETYPDMRQEVKHTVAQGDFVAVHSHGTRSAADREAGRGSALLDLFRLEHGRIVEHWDVIESIPERAANDNTMF